ncbi:MAG: DUF2726 domain-containing protein [Thermoflexus sp.]
MQEIGACLIGLSLLFLVALILFVAALWRSPASRRGLRGVTVQWIPADADEALDVGEIKPLRLLSDSEAAFYWTLKKAIGERWVIAVKVPLMQIMRRRRRLPSELYQMLEHGHVDFLLLHPRSWEPVIAIELDDTSHLTSVRRDRDRRKDELFRIAGIPLLRWQVGQNWNVEEIAQKLWQTAASRES